MKKLITTMTMTALLSAPAFAAGEAAWDGAMRETIREIASQVPGTTVPADAAAFNRHFACFASEFFGSLQLEVQRLPPRRMAYPDPSEQGTVRVRLQGYHAEQAAHSLGLPAADSIEADFPEEWCQFSAAAPGVFSCELPDWEWPRSVLRIDAFDRSGKHVGSGTVAEFRIGVEKTLRTSAGTGADIQSQFLELAASLISETDNAARAELRLSYQPQDCRAK